MAQYAWECNHTGTRCAYTMCFLLHVKKQVKYYDS